ncbi:E3 ubiquitin-protein ligase RNF8-like [Lingula anatina]|uniref:E3 ubiquitin-protein ligase CHFR n=1 Tax=Lingula anatina TaxID=7574 RepID=A0A1S3H8P8_LINAN|nr:E3 ubiquitin-protein ligase RNF8-like [Lingula anatina]|eukprot:XP_013381504.1 E3 ubiquitin-protein ligase RNF8-like [Lingula anatina]
MATFICCLRRVGEISNKRRIEPLENKSEVIIGRHKENAICITDSVMISRKHAVLKKLQDGSWTITDNKSLNGVKVNDKQLIPSQPYLLKDGDRIQLGIPPNNASSEPVVVFQYHTCLRVKCKMIDKISSKRKHSEDSVSSKSKCVKYDHVFKHPHSEQIRNPGAVWSPSLQMKKQLEEQERLHQEKLKAAEKEMEEMRKRLEEKEAAQKEMLKQLQENEERINLEKQDQKQKLQEAENMISEMVQALKEREQTKAQMIEDIRQKEEEARLKLEQQRANMEEERKKFEEEMKSEVQKQLQEKEELLRQQLTVQRNALLEEKERIEKDLQQEMERKLEEKDKDLENRLLKEKENLEKIISNKELEQKMLESQLNETKIENEKTKEQMLKAREDVLTNFADVMETELQCSICNELFIQATSLNCSHSFCAYCIGQWIEKKKECPICRSAITFKNRSIVLDSYIDRMVEHLSEEMKENRKILIESRKEEQAVIDEKQKSLQTHRVPPRAHDVIDLSSSEDEDEDEDEEDSEVSVEGEDGVYYGGYGQCFNCGHRGHWANGCPFR